MKKLETLTKEQESLIPIHRQEYLDIFYKKELDKKIAIEEIGWLYKFCKKEKPVIFFMDSPLGVAILFNLLSKNNIRANIRDNIRGNIRANIRANIEDNIWDNIRDNIWDNIRDNIWANIGDNIRDNIRDNIWANIGDNIRANIRDNIWANIRANIRDNTPQSSYYGNISDYGWIAFYDYFQKLNHFTDYNWDDFNHFRNLIKSGIYELYTFENICIVVNKPKTSQENNRLHNEKEAAVKFNDGFSMYFWQGINVPKQWIINKEDITKEDIIKETNAEKRRILQEILGTKKFAKLLDIHIINEDIDRFGLPMKLYKTKQKDTLINDFIYFLNVICPSTKREYFLCVPPTVKNVWEAKAWTFKNEKIEIRHGDISLLNLKKEFNQPIYES